METKCSLSCSQHPTIGPSPEPHESTPHYSFKIQFNAIPAPMPWWATCLTHLPLIWLP